LSTILLAELLGSWRPALTPVQYLRNGEMEVVGHHGTPGHGPRLHNATLEPLLTRTTTAITDHQRSY
jgi:hypothetical protein